MLAQPSLVKDVTIPMNAVTMGDKAYSPNPIDVKVGEGVTWTNDDSQIHTATSGAAGSADAGSVFDSGIMSPDATFDFVFDTAGTYDYHCNASSDGRNCQRFLTNNLKLGLVRSNL